MAQHLPMQLHKVGRHWVHIAGTYLSKTPPSRVPLGWTCTFAVAAAWIISLYSTCFICHHALANRFSQSQFRALRILPVRPVGILTSLEPRSHVRRNATLDCMIQEPF